MNLDKSKKIAIVGGYISEKVFPVISRNDLTPVCVSNKQRTLSHFDTLDYEVLDFNKSDINPKVFDVVVISTKPSLVNEKLDLKELRATTAKIAEGFLKEHEGIPLIVFADMDLPFGLIKNELVSMLEAISQKTAGVGFNICYLPEIPDTGEIMREILIGELKESSGLILEQIFKTNSTTFVHLPLNVVDMIQNGRVVLEITQKAGLDELAILCVEEGVDFEKVLPSLLREKQEPLQITKIMLTSIENIITTMPVTEKAWRTLSSVPESSIAGAQVPVTKREFSRVV